MDMSSQFYAPATFPSVKNPSTQ